MASFELLMQFFLNGIVLGSILALAAIGLTLVYGILNLPNFAHGDYMVLGAYAAILFNVKYAVGRDQTNAVITAVVIAAVLIALALVDWRATRKLESHERNTLFGMSGLLLLAAGAQWMGPDSALPGFLVNPLVLPSLLAIVLVAIFAIGADYVIWRPMRRRHSTIITYIIMSIGLALFLRHVLAMYFGSGFVRYRRPPVESLSFADLTITGIQLATIIITAVLILLVHLFLKYTRTGKGLRALSDNMELARVSGINVDRMILYVWVIGGALVTIAGILLGLNTQVFPNMGFLMLLPIFAAVILGGIGSAYGAMLGGLVIGVAMETSVALHPSYRFAAAFFVLILVLLVRPQGILGGKV